MNKDKISIALSKTLIPKINDKCRRINRNRSNYIETVLIEDLQKDENKPRKAREEIGGFSKTPNSPENDDPH